MKDVNLVNEHHKSRNLPFGPWCISFSIAYKTPNFLLDDESQVGDLWVGPVCVQCNIFYAPIVSFIEALEATFFK